MDQALYISKLSSIKYFQNDFTRIYFGQEFCERLLPQKTDLENIIAFSSDNNVPLTLVTPYVTDKGLLKLEKLIAFFAQKMPKAEIVFNDWGVFQFIQENFPELKPVLGRLLNKQKRGPRITNIIDQVPKETREYYTGASLDVSATAGFLKKKNIFRVEFDNLLQGLDMSGLDKEIKRSLYLPYLFISTTRFCLTANCDVGDTGVGVMPCHHECQKYTFNLNNPVMKQPLIRKGNTIFAINDNIPETVPKGEVDRIVIQPEIPL
jgi:hypothetical protein